MGVYWVLLDSTGFLRGLTGFDRVLSGFIWFYRVLPGFSMHLLIDCCPLRTRQYVIHSTPELIGGKRNLWAVNDLIF